MNSGELVGSGLQCNTTVSSVEGAARDPQALVWRCLGEGSSVTQAVEAEVVVRGWLDQGLQAAVGPTLGRRAGGMGEVALGGARQEALPLLT